MESFASYMALGDRLAEHTYSGATGDTALSQSVTSPDWAARLAVILRGHASLAGRPFTFADRTCADARIREVVDTDIPTAVELESDLVSVMIGGSDLLAQRRDPDALTNELEIGIRSLRSCGARVLLAGSFDVRSCHPSARLRSRAAAFNAGLWRIARANECTMLDLWSTRDFHDPSMWTHEGVQLSARGHRALAARAAHALHVPYAEVGSRQHAHGSAALTTTATSVNGGVGGQR